MLDRLTARPWQVAHLARDFAALHVAMHASDGTGLPGYKQSCGRMIERAGPHLGQAAQAAILRRLAALPDGTAVCHGDMHPGNVLVTRTGPVVIDWLTAGIGPPAADVARTLFLLRDAAIPADIPLIERAGISLVRRLFAARYLAAYRRLGGFDPHEVERWRLPVLAARLGEEIDAERASILALIERELARGPTHVASDGEACSTGRLLGQPRVKPTRDDHEQLDPGIALGARLNSMALNVLRSRIVRVA